MKREGGREGGLGERERDRKGRREEGGGGGRGGKREGLAIEHHQNESPQFTIL